MNERTRHLENYLRYNHADVALPLFERIKRYVRAFNTVFVEGDDLSHYNTILNWYAKQTENKFSVLKLGEGIGTEDNTLFEKATAARNSGTLVMGYWYFRARFGGIAQAQACIAVVDELTTLLGYKPVIWVDVEELDGQTKQTLLSRLQSCVSYLTPYHPNKIGIYTSPGFANVNLAPLPTWLLNLHWWIAHWTSASMPTLPTGLTLDKVRLWQYGIWDNYSWAKPVPGGVPDIDTDRWFGDEASLIAFVGAPPPMTLEQRLTLVEAQVADHEERIGELEGVVTP